MIEHALQLLCGLLLGSIIQLGFELRRERRKSAALQGMIDAYDERIAQGKVGLVMFRFEAKLTEVDEDRA